MAEPLKILLIEDSEDDAMLTILEVRRAGYEPVVRRVETSEEMIDAVENGKWDVVISDYILPRFNGLEALQMLQESGLDLPFIIVSGKIGEDVAVDAMKAGAHDYILKDNLSRLVPAIDRELREAEVRRQRRMADEALKRAYEELELKVQERTAELSSANEALELENLQRRQAEKDREIVISELQAALAEVKTLSGLLPICASCKKIRDDTGYWNQIEVYIRKHSSAEFSHGICPECAKRLYPDIFKD